MYGLIIFSDVQLEKMERYMVRTEVWRTTFFWFRSREKRSSLWLVF